MAEKVKDPKKTILRLWNYLKYYKKQLILITVFIILSTLLSVIAPLILSFLVDQFASNQNLKQMLTLLIILGFCYLLISLLTFVTNVLMVTISESSLYQIRKDLFEHLEHLPLSFFDHNKKGDLMSRFTNDISIIDNALSDAVTEVISSVITLVGVTIIIFVVNPILAVTTIVTVPIFFVCVLLIGKKAGDYYDKQQASLGEVSSYSEEMITGMKVIKSYKKEQETMEQFEKKNEELKKFSIKAEVYSNFVMPLNTAITNLGTILLIGIGALLILKGQSTIGEILAFLTYSSMFRKPINQLASLYASIQGALAGAERVFEIMDVEPEKLTEKNGEIQKIKGHVTFRDVNFSYEKGTPVLKKINLDVPQGKMVALVGPTGAGKTTFVNLLTRFYEVDSGEILIDGKAIQNISKETLRKKIGIVLQDTYLFKGTVKENICYGNRNASFEEILKASKKAQAHSFIHRLPQGYDSLVEEEGSNFSQGQRQLIAIARVILANPEILILDEATSNIDTKTEMKIQKGMKALMKGRTTFVIAHRLSTIRQSDEILVLQNGEIIERGTHESLLRKNGFYKKLYESQFNE